MALLVVSSGRRSTRSSSRYPSFGNCKRVSKLCVGTTAWCSLPLRAVQDRIAWCNNLLLAECATERVSRCSLDALIIAGLPKVQEANSHRILVLTFRVFVMSVLKAAFATVRVRSFGQRGRPSRSCMRGLWPF